MNDALDPIRHVYGEAVPVEEPDAPLDAERALLQSTKSVLDRMPRPQPDPATLDVVCEAAAAHTYAPLRQAYGEAEGAPAPGTPRHAEYALLRSMRTALDQAPRPRPDASVLAAVSAMAANHALAPLRHAYAEADGAPPLTPAQHAECALLQSTKSVLDRMPCPRPDAAVLAAISAAAARPAHAPRAADRPAHPRRIQRWGAWVGSAAAVVLATVTGLWALQNGPALDQAAEPMAAQVEPAPRVEADAEAPADVEKPAEGLLAQAAPPTAAPAREEAARSASARRSADPAAPDVATPTPRRAAAPPPPEAAGFAAVSEPAAPAPDTLPRLDGETLPVSTWEAGNDVRVLSLRLQQLAESNEGLAWGEPIAPLGAAGAEAYRAADAGLLPVRAGAAPARVEVRMRTGTPARSTGEQPNP